MSGQHGWPYEAVEAGGASARDVASLPRACTLSDAEMRARTESLRSGFVGAVKRFERIPQGYVYWFARNDDNMSKVAAFALFESGCCNFLSFGIGLHPDGDEISLRISGPDEAGPELFHQAVRGSACACCGAAS